MELRSKHIVLMLLVVGLCCATLVWLVPNRENSANSSGIVVVSQADTVNRAAVSAVDLKSFAPEVSPRPAGGFFNGAKSPDARETSVPLPRKSLESEQRDAPWAAPTERAIIASLRDVPGIEVGSIKVVCASSLCDAHGQTVKGASATNVEQAHDYLKASTFAEALATANVLPQQAEIDQRNGIVSFDVKFDRIHR